MHTITITTADYVALRSAALAGIAAFHNEADGRATALSLLSEGLTDQAQKALDRLSSGFLNAANARLARPHFEPEPYSMTRALDEGWLIDRHAETGQYMIVADGSTIDCDEQASDHVHGCAEAGEEYHQGALKWIEEANALVATHGPLTSRPAPRIVA